jgi:membrane protein required for colicin V production
MDWIDWIIVIIIGSAGLFGLFRGLVHEVVSIIGWIAAFILAKLFSPTVYELLGSWLEQDSVRWVLAWMIPFITVLLIAAAIKFILRELLETTGLGGVNIALGGVFGVIKGGLIITVVVLLLRLTIFSDFEPIRPQSRLLPYFDKFAAQLADPIADYLSPKIQQLKMKVQELDSQGETPDPIMLLNELGWDDKAMDYIRAHPEMLNTVLQELKDNPDWRKDWEEKVAEWKQKIQQD